MYKRYCCAFNGGVMTVRDYTGCFTTCGHYRVRHKSVNTPVRHTSVNTPSSHERHVVRNWLAVYSGWG